MMTEDVKPLFVIEINTLANHCGFFNGKTDTNNGYGCDHPDCDEIEDGQGKCLASSCPLIHRASKRELLSAGFKSAISEEDDYLSLDFIVISEKQVKDMSIPKRHLFRMKNRRTYEIEERG